MAAHGSYFIIASIADRNRAYSTASDRQVIVGFFMGNVPIFANYRAKSNAIGGAAGIRTLDELLAHTHFPGERLRPLGHRSALLGRRALAV